MCINYAYGEREIALCFIRAGLRRWNF